MANENESQDIRKSEIIEFPKHLFLPSGSESLDLRKLVTMGANTLNPVSVLRFQVPKGRFGVITGYSIYSDVELEEDVEFIPRVDGKRVLQYHGNPNFINANGAESTRLSLGLAPDLSTLIPCYIRLKEQQVIEFLSYNKSSVDSYVGVRIAGYLDSSNKYEQNKFGG